MNNLIISILFNIVATCIFASACYFDDTNLFQMAIFTMINAIYWAIYWKIKP